MAIRQVWLGPLGPWDYDDADVYNQDAPGDAGEGPAQDLTTLTALRCDGPIRIDNAPTDVTDAVRLDDLAGALNPSIRLLASVTGVDLTQTGNVAVYSGSAQATYLFLMLVRVTAATGVTSVPSIGIIQDPGNTTVVPRAPAIGMDAIGDTRTIFVAGTSFVFGGGAVGDRSIDLSGGAATGTYEASVFMFGWEDPNDP